MSVGVSDDEVIGTFRRYRDLAVGKGYVKNAGDITPGKVAIPAGGNGDVAKARAMTGGFTWAFSVRPDGQDGLNRYIKESPADVQAVNLIGLYPLPLDVMTHDHVDRLG